MIKEYYHNSNNANLYKNLFLVFGIVILSWMVYAVGPDKIYANLQKTGWWFLVVLVIWLVVYLINTVSFQLIIKDGSPESGKIKFLHTLKIVISGYAINYITPFGLLGGEPYKVIELKPAIGVNKSTSSVILYAMMHVVSHMILWVFSVLLIIFYVPEKNIGLTISLWLIFVFCSYFIFWAFKGYKKGLVFKLFSLLTKLPFLKKKLKNFTIKNESHLKEIDEMIKDLFVNRRKTFFLSLGAELLSRFIICFEVYFILFSIGYNVSYPQCIIIIALASLFANLVFFLPLQLGSREGGFALAFSILSLLGPVGIFVGICTRIRELFWIFVGISILKYKSLK